MSIAVREADVEGYLVRELKRAGFLCLKFHPEDRIGMPDRVVLLGDGRVMWVELKTDNGRLSAIQKYRHKELTAAGQEVVVVWNKESADDLVMRIKENANGE